MYVVRGRTRTLLSPKREHLGTADSCRKQQIGVCLLNLGRLSTTPGPVKEREGRNRRVREKPEAAEVGEADCERDRDVEHREAQQILREAPDTFNF